MDEPNGAMPPCCPVCGAPYTAGTTVCAACGTPMTLNPSSAPTPAPPERVVDPAEMEARGTERRCRWCGALSPADSERCVQCGAMFPRPEQDAAVQRASQERIRVASDEIELLRRQRAKRGLNRFFKR